MRTLNLDFLCAKYPFVKKLTEKKSNKYKKTLQMMHLNLQHPQEKDSEKGSHFLSIFLANQTQTSLIYCYCLSLYDCMLQFLFYLHKQV